MGDAIEAELEKLDGDGKFAVFENVATGQVDSEADCYRIKVRITEFTVGGNLSIKVDVEEVSPLEFIRRFIKCESGNSG